MPNKSDVIWCRKEKGGKRCDLHGRRRRKERRNMEMGILKVGEIVTRMKHWP